jgi:GNAT superfamily N-acetyltransferase
VTLPEKWNGFDVTTRLDKDEIFHVELYQPSPLAKVIRSVPLNVRPKPQAKTGIRAYISSSSAMDSLIAAAFDENSSVNIPVAIFVYMWVQPDLRGNKIGDFLLETGKNLCRSVGARYMIIVHDDDGSGKLISYYERRGFIPIFDFLEKGMICRLD